MMRRRSLLLAVLLALVSGPTSARDGNWVGNGGDSLALALYQRTRELSQKMQELTPACAERLELKAGKFAAILERLEINTSPTPLYLEEEGRPVYKEALNYPDQMVVVYNREAIKGSPSTDQLILHETLGLARIADPQGLQSKLIYQTLRQTECLTHPLERPRVSGPGLEEGDVPVSSQMDRHGVVYFLVGGRAKIYRYSLDFEQFLEPLITRDEPEAFVVDSLGQHLYVLYPGKVITQFDLQQSLQEKEFARVTLQLKDYMQQSDLDRFNHSEIADLFLVGSRVVVVPPATSEWRILHVYDSSGHKQAQFEWVPPFRTYAPYANKKGFYLISEFLPQGFEFLSIESTRGTRAQVQNRTPEGVSVSGTLVASPTQIALGSGYVVSTDDKNQSVKRLGHSFEKGTWVGHVLYSAWSSGSGFEVKGEMSPDFHETQTLKYPSGSLLALHQWNQHLVVIWVNDSGQLKIETVSD